MESDNSKLGGRADLRKVTDRRTCEQSWPHDRRVQPDRRLNNISVEWVPFREVKSHPIIRDALSSHRNKRKATGTGGKEQLENEQWENEPSMVNIFQNNWSPLIDLRNVPDRRTRDQKQPYDRRVQPDRRLSHISVEWITY